MKKMKNQTVYSGSKLKVSEKVSLFIFYQKIGKGVFKPYVFLQVPPVRGQIYVGPGLRNLKRMDASFL